MKASEFIPESEQLQIVDAIAKAELNTSGEIRVHIEPRCKEKNVLQRAVRVFDIIDMEKTGKRNGVLIYIAFESCKFAIIGDKGINDLVPGNFWWDIEVRMKSDFAAGRFTEGICQAVISVGEALKQYFPYEDGDINEQTNEISFGDEA
ncbi:MAG: TPM domain-containing protein [Bacteroidales bacterium]|mgnify:CR=1 FL=1|nr:TPM domain-containing protein [Bacteroidales bacterium]MDD4671172.1 TPM domain-containing protein [Bacteroidales bacterium]